MIELTGKYTNAKIMIDEVEPKCLSQIIAFLNHPAFNRYIAIMPDTHHGKASVIGFTMPLSETILPNIIGVDISCFTGNTKVKLTDNRSLSFIDLIKEYEQGKKNYCFSLDRNNNVRIDSFVPKKTTKTKELLEIKLDNDEIIHCTKDHIFYKRNGEKVEAKDLNTNDSLMPLYIQEAKKVKEKLSHEQYLEKHLTVYNPNSNNYDYIHHLADKYNVENDDAYNKRVTKFIRHHKDFNKLNNNPENIERLVWKDQKQLRKEVNHKIKSIKNIVLEEPEQMYCLTTSKYGSFALDSGVFVKNCGIFAVKLSIKIKPEDLAELDNKIRDAIPMGFKINNSPEMIGINVYKKAYNTLVSFVQAYEKKFGIKLPITNQYNDIWLREKCKQIGEDVNRVLRSIGTLGGGNHFIEIGVDQNGDQWLTVHTGSRHFGLTICNYWQNLAYKKRLENDKLCEDKIKEIVNESEDKTKIAEKIKKVKQENVNNFDKDLAYLTVEEGYEYLFDMIFAQAYADYNRSVIVKRILNIIGTEAVETISSVHNYIDFKDMVIRKGAIRSYEGEKMVIPFNMRDGILICEGKSNEEWNYSAPHGAGRVLSRSEAKEFLNIDTFKDQMKGIYSSSVCHGTLDEAPDAYKDAKIIEAAIGPTCTIINRIKPILNLKAVEHNFVIVKEENGKYIVVECFNNKHKANKFVRKNGSETRLFVMRSSNKYEPGSEFNEPQ